MAKFKIKLDDSAIEGCKKSELREELFRILDKTSFHDFSEVNYEVKKVKEKSITLKAKNKKVIKEIMKKFDLYESGPCGNGFAVCNGYTIKKLEKKEKEKDIEK